MCHLLALEWIQNGIVVGEEEVEVDLTVSETLKAGLSTVVSTGMLRRRMRTRSRLVVAISLLPLILSME